eukprot:7283384-Prymnesium_polylepis.1
MVEGCSLAKFQWSEVVRLRNSHRLTHTAHTHDPCRDMMRAARCVREMPNSVCVSSRTACYARWVLR